MPGSSLMRYTYNEMEALRQTAAVLGALTSFLAFLGGYYSGQRGWWWLAFFTVVVFWMWMGFLRDPNLKQKSYDKYIMVGVSSIMALFFLLVFLAGYWTSGSGVWWPGLSLILIYFILARIITKPHKHKS